MTNMCWQRYVVVESILNRNVVHKSKLCLPCSSSDWSFLKTGERLKILGFLTRVELGGKWWQPLEYGAEKMERIYPLGMGQEIIDWYFARTVRVDTRKKSPPFHLFDFRKIKCWYMYKHRKSLESLILEASKNKLKWSKVT